MSALGASLRDGGVTFRVWAPRCRGVEVVLDGRAPVPLARGEGGVHEATVSGLAPGARHRFRLDGSAEARFAGPGRGVPLLLFQVLLYETAR